MELGQFWNSHNFQGARVEEARSQGGTLFDMITAISVFDFQGESIGKSMIHNMCIVVDQSL